MVALVLGANITAVIASNITVMDKSITKETVAVTTSQEDGTSGLTNEQQLAYIRDVRSKDKIVADNWSEAEMMREIAYHDRGYRFLKSIGLGNCELAEKLRWVGFEKKQTFITYLRRFLGNLMFW